jgi:nucleosome assembly protein 1-like 1
MEFFFDTNPYLKNFVLTKTYHMIDDDELILEKAIGNLISVVLLKCFVSSFAGSLHMSGIL